MRSTNLILLLICSYLLVSVVSVHNQRILRRVIKSTPTATNLTRVKSVTITQVDALAQPNQQPSFGKRDAQSISNSTSTLFTPTTTILPVLSSTSTSTSAPITSTISNNVNIATSTAQTNAKVEPVFEREFATKSKRPESPTTRVLTAVTNENDSQREVGNQNNRSTTSTSSEVELLSVAASVPVPAAEAPKDIVAAESGNNDLSSSSSSNVHQFQEDSSSMMDVLRSSSSSTDNYATKGGSINKLRLVQQQQHQQQHQQHRQQQQQNFFYPSQLRQQETKSRQANYETKTSFYRPQSTTTTTTTTTTTPRPAPLIQQQQDYNHLDYQQQSEQYVEQQNQVDYGAAPLGQAEPFAFDFKMDDNQGNGQYRKEESDKDGVVRGSYGYTDANGIYRHVEYIADINGFRANIKSNEPGLQGETMPASIKMAHSGSNNNDNNNQQATTTQKLQSSNNNNDNSWASASVPVATFESSHKPERIRLPRNNIISTARFAPAPVRPISVGAELEFGAHI